jgi:hypothetical protein
MVRDDAVQILRNAIARHQTLFREAWDNREWGIADEHWKHLLVLRREDENIRGRTSNS